MARQLGARVCQSTARNTYRVTQKVLDKQLTPVLAPNPHYKRSAPMKLYDIKDVLSLAFERHGNLAGVRRYEERLSQQAAKRKANAAKKKKERRKELARALARYGLEIRSDSRLAAAYMKGSNEFTLDQITEKLARAKLMREYCDWELFYDAAFRVQRDERKKYGITPELRVWERAEEILGPVCNQYSTLANYPWLHGVSVSSWRANNSVYNTTVRDVEHAVY